MGVKRQNLQPLGEFSDFSEKNSMRYLDHILNVLRTILKELNIAKISKSFEINKLLSPAPHPLLMVKFKALVFELKFLSELTWGRLKPPFPAGCVIELSVLFSQKAFLLEGY